MCRSRGKKRIPNSKINGAGKNPKIIKEPKTPKGVFFKKTSLGNFTHNYYEGVFNPNLSQKRQPKNRTIGLKIRYITPEEKRVKSVNTFKSMYKMHD